MEQMILAEAHDELGDNGTPIATYRIIRDATGGEYYFEYSEGGFASERRMENLDHALREFSSAVREIDKWSQVAEARKSERRRAK